MGYKHLARYREIVNILGKHGLGFLLGHLERKKAVDTTEAEDGLKLTTAQRLKRALEELGPTFVKLGQLLSIRPDLLPKEYLEQLELLQDQVEPIPFNRVEKVLEEELTLPLEKVFAVFDKTPLASASIGQVHKGKLITGEDVVIKVQRPGVARQVEVDLAILFDLARIAESKTKLGAHYKLVDLAEELARTITQELDYSIEGRNADRLAQNFTGDETVKIPKIYWEYSTKKILIMEYIAGIKINNFEQLKKKGYDQEKIVKNLTTALLKQIYIHGFFHADPHPGNLAVLPNEKIVFMDFGMMGRVDEELKERFVSIILAVISKDINTIVEVLMAIGVAAKKLDKQSLKKDIDNLLEKYYHVPLSQLKIGDVLKEMLSLAYVYQIRIPAEVTLVAKTLITLEGLVQQLDTKISIIDIAEPFGKLLVKERYSPQRVKKDVVQHFWELFRFVKAFPKRVDNLLNLVEEGEIKVKLEHININPFLNRVGIISNRLSFAIIIGSLIIGSSLVASRKEDSLLLNFPIAEVGFIIAVIMGLWLVVSILRSGRI